MTREFTHGATATCRQERRAKRFRRAPARGRKETSRPIIPLPISCQTAAEGNGDDNLALRIGSIFIILCISSAACTFPILAARLPGLRIPPVILFGVRHFGTGVLIATAFVHLLPTAFRLLGDPCLSSFWTEDYPAVWKPLFLNPEAPVIKPPSAFVSPVLIDGSIMLLHPARRDLPEPASEDTGGSGGAASGGNVEHGQLVNSSGVTVTSDQKRKKQAIHCCLLEMGILFHSLFIGMALSVTIGGNAFVVLLIAIAFHQTFEGLALGARIAAVEWPHNSLQPWYMAVAFGCTAPIGQAIGLATRSAYSPESEVGLILVGVMNALSSGFLIFASLVELLAEDLLTDESWRVLRGKRRMCAFLLVIGGAFAMSLVAAWA
ncbi:Uu.00g120890.m01.CDS01 [Anthostomella pinea]|uniref:Uu.00g120890.m01.CDS01 n=1 Tax=Anthostomella pinea TaxID=933095 RepID=A0AAI8YH61_9PEZI|nr:Uu.00g120890.m01.CDS01 [Anthostomella pinea]